MVGDTVVASYPSLPEAVKGAAAGQTVKLTSNVELQKTLEVDKDVVLDLNGFTISALGSDSKAFSNGAIKLSSSATLMGKGSVVSDYCAIQVNGWSKAERIEIRDCSISTSNGRKAVLDVRDTVDGSTVTLQNCKVINSGGGNAFERSWNESGSVLFEDCIVEGLIKPAFTAASPVDSMVTIAGGYYSNGDQQVFANANTKAGLAELAKHLVVKSGYFKVEPQSELVASTSSCVATGDSAYPFNVVDEGQQGAAYTVDDAGGKVYHATLDAALQAAKGSKVYLVAAVEVSDCNMLRGADIKGFPGAEIKYAGNLRELLSAGSSLNQVKLTCSDATVLNAEASAGALSAGTCLQDDMASVVSECVADGYLVNDGDSNSSILPESAFEARIGKLGYPYLVNAVTVAGSYESTKPANEEIVLLKDQVKDNSVVEVMAPNATFTLNLNGHAIKSANGSGLLVLPNANGADITVKNGTIEGRDFGVVTNGTLRDIRLQLDGVTVKSTSADGAGVYLPAVASETVVHGGNIAGATGIEVRGGTLTVKGDVKVSGTSADFAIAPNDNGTTTQGAGIAVAQHTTKDAIRVEFLADDKGLAPTVEGVYALYEANPQNNPQEDISKVTLDIKAGAFRSTKADGQALYAQNCKGFVSGGSFSSDPKDYLADGFEAAQSDGSFEVAKPVPPSGGGAVTPSDKTEVEHNADGSTTTTVTKPDGSQTVTHETANGTESVVSKDESGNVVSAEVSVSDKDAESGAVELPIAGVEPVAAAAADALEVEVKVPASVTPGNPVAVTVPVAKAEGDEPNYGLVVFAVDADGNETVLPKSAVDADGNVVFEAEGDVTIKVVDNAKAMPDVKDSDWFAGDVVDFATARGIINGVPQADGTFEFQGDAGTSRAMFVMMLHNLEANPAPVSGESLDDVASSDWYADAAAWAVEAGVLEGIETDSGHVFRGESPVTREQVAMFLMRYASYLGMDVSARAQIASPDAAEVSDWAREAMSWAVAEEIFKGDGVTGELNPTDGATRAELATVLMRFIVGMYA